MGIPGLKLFSPRGRPRRITLVLAGVCLLLPVRAYLNAQEPVQGQVKRGLILTVNRPLDREADRLFRGVIAQSVRWSLERRQLLVVEEYTPWQASAAKDEAFEIPDELDGSQIDYVLLSEYASQGPNLEIRLAWYDPSTLTGPTEVTRQGPKDLVLDRMIRDALNELLAEVESSIAALPQRVIAPQAPTTAARNAGLTGSSSPADHTVNGSEPPAQAGPSIASPEIAENPAVPELPGGGTSEPAQLENPGRKRHFEIGLGCAPFVATGEASEYFKLGILPAVNFSYLFQGERRRFALGLYAAMNYFTASGESTSAETFIIPVGVSLRCELGSERFPTMIFGVSSGPAVLLMSTSARGQLAGLTFYGRGSLGVRLPIGQTFGITIETGYEFYWEQPRPIMGFSPSVAATLRL